MKKALIGVAIAVATSSAFASGFCRQLGGLAETIMKSRQNGVPMSRVIEINRTTGNGSEQLDRIVDKMIIMAYDTPRFSTAEFKVRAIENFRNDIELACYR